MISHEEGLLPSILVSHLCVYSEMGVSDLDVFSDFMKKISSFDYDVRSFLLSKKIGDLLSDYDLLSSIGDDQLLVQSDFDDSRLVYYIIDYERFLKNPERGLIFLDDDFYVYCKLFSFDPSFRDDVSSYRREVFDLKM